MAMIGLFPASGGLGGSIAKHLLQIVDPKRVVLICRYPERLPKEYLAAGAIARQADYDQPESLQSAFDDISTLFLVSYPSIQHEHRFKVHKCAIDAAQRSSPGVRHIFYSSLAFAGGSGRHSHAHVMQAHISTEDYLESLSAHEANSKSFTWTSVREGIYSETWPMYAGFPDTSRSVLEAAIPHRFDGPGVAWIKRDELGEASAQLIRQYVSGNLGGEVENQIILLSGSRDWSLADTLQVIGSVMGKEIHTRQVSLEEYVQLPAVTARLSSHGLGDVPRQWSTVYMALESGETSVVSPWTERLLGRPPEDFKTTMSQQ